MIRTLLFAASLSAALIAGPALAKQYSWPADKLGKETSIPFMGELGLYDFHPDDTKGVWLEDQQRRWYYARTLGPCNNLISAMKIGVDTRFGGNQLDRTGTLLVDGERCALTSLTASNGPPPRPKKHNKG